MKIVHARKAALVLSEGGLVAYPTEGVYGLGCDPLNQAAVFSLLELKRREAGKGLILVSGHIEHFSFLLSKCSVADCDKMLQTWPGPVTWIVPHYGQVPLWISGGRDTVAIRVSAHPVICAITQFFSMPIVSTSANFSGDPPAKTIYQLNRLRPKLDYIVPGPILTPGVPSKMIDLKTGIILRN